MNKEASSSTSSCCKTSEAPVCRQVIHLLSGTYYLDFNSSFKDELKKASLFKYDHYNDSSNSKKDSDEPRKITQKRTSITTSVSSPRLSITSLKTFERDPTVHNWNVYNTNCNANIITNIEDDGFQAKEFRENEHMSCLIAAFTVFAIFSYLGDILSSIATTTLLFRDNHILWFSLSLCFTVLPTIIINIFSLIWYWEDELYRNSKGIGRQLRVLLHCAFLGIVCRNVDILINGFRANRQSKTIHSPAQRSKYFILYVEQRKVTAYLNMIKCFIQNAPQFSLQVYIWTVQNRSSTRLLLDNFYLIQYASIAISLVTLSYSIVSYHQALSFSEENVEPMNVTACIGQFIWRLGTTGSRILAIILALSAYPYPTVFVIFIHWIIMIGVNNQQGMGILIKKYKHNGFKRLYSVLMGAVHIFCFLNVVVNENRNRLIFFYVIQFIEDCFFIGLWYLQMVIGNVNYQPWIYHTGLFIYLNSFFVGIIAMVLFYQRFHPRMISPSYDMSYQDEESEERSLDSEGQNKDKPMESHSELQQSKLNLTKLQNGNTVNVHVSKPKRMNDKNDKINFNNVNYDSSYAYCNALASDINADVGHSSRESIHQKSSIQQ